eukprot:TRINITY_DN3302_c0_g3_i2.p1 TRINITY_DN3302_c0_g3~~TRINITY_DN3302_c0_g3_i2.p1  ORF type:complete len:203 (-),score=18.22 TRINITY_DN3302_c0_g3_i2:505-1086(-)
MNNDAECSGNNCNGQQGGSNAQTTVAIYALSVTGGIILLCIIYAFFCRSRDEDLDMLQEAQQAAQNRRRKKSMKVCKLPSHTRIVVMPGEQVQLATRVAPSPTLSSKSLKYLQDVGNSARQPSVQSTVGDDSTFMYQASSFGDNPTIRRFLASSMHASGGDEIRDSETNQTVIDDSIGDYSVPSQPRFGQDAC